MNKIILTAGLALSLITSVHAQNLSALTVSGTLDYESEYVFRGKKITASAFPAERELRLSRRWRQR